MTVRAIDAPSCRRAALRTRPGPSGPRTRPWELGRACCRAVARRSRRAVARARAGVPPSPAESARADGQQGQQCPAGRPLGQRDSVGPHARRRSSPCQSKPARPRRSATPAPPPQQPLRSSIALRSRDRFERPLHEPRCRHRAWHVWHSIGQKPPAADVQPPLAPPLPSEGRQRRHHNRPDWTACRSSRRPGRCSARTTSCPRTATTNWMRCTRWSRSSGRADRSRRGRSSRRASAGCRSPVRSPPSSHRDRRTTIRASTRHRAPARRPATERTAAPDTASAAEGSGATARAICEERRRRARPARTTHQPDQQMGLPSSRVFAAWVANWYACTLAHAMVGVKVQPPGADRAGSRPANHPRSSR